METVSNYKPVYLGIAIGAGVMLIVVGIVFLWQSRKTEKLIASVTQKLNDSFDKRLESIRQESVKQE
jgi:sensor domain CHASE-containing protein